MERKKHSPEGHNEDVEMNGGAANDIPEEAETGAECIEENDICEKKKESEFELRFNELNDKYIRTCAEYDNYRRRTVKEKEEARQYVLCEAAELFLPMADALESALKLSRDDKGIEILQKQLDDIFVKMGITEIKADGEKFDPELHNAIMHEEDSSQSENTVIQTFRKGYRVGDKIIRHSMVKVVN